MATLNRLVTVFSANTTSFTAGTKKMSGSMAAFKTNVLASGKAINASLNRIGLAAGIAAGLMIKHYAQFEKRMVTVGAILGKNRAEMGLLTDAAKRMGRTTIFTATQAAEAQQVMAMAGLTQNEILLALGPALQLAAVGEVEIAEAAEIAAKTMRGMNLSAADLYRVNNVLAGALVSSTTNMTQLGNALKYVAPLASATNTSIEDTVAMIGKLSSAGFQGEMAGTGLRQAMAKLAGSTPHATKVLKDYGIVTLDSSRNMLPMFDILYQMEQQALSAGQVFEIFGARAGPQMLALLSVGVEGLEAYSDELERANDVGKAAQIEQQKLDTIWGAWKLMISAVSGVVIDSSEKIAGAIRTAQFRFTQFFTNLDSRAGIINVLSSFMESFVGMLESVLFWINENQAGVLELVGALTGITVWIFDFMADYPQLMAALVALKISGFMGITTAVLSMAKVLWSLILAVFPQLSVWLTALKTKFLLLAGSIRTMSLAMAGGVVAGVVAGYVLLRIELSKLNDEYERGNRALEKLNRLQMKGVDADTQKAIKIKDTSDQMDALGEIQQKLDRSTESATKRLTQKEEALRKINKQRLEFEERGVFAAGISDMILGPKIKAAEKEVENEKANLKAIELRRKDVEGLFRQAEAKVQAGIDADNNRDAAAVMGGMGGGGMGGGGMGGGGMGGGGMGGGGGPVGNVAKAIADRIKDTRRTEEREKFGRPAAREGAELEKFLDLGPAKDELLSFMDTLDELTQAERDGLIKRRSEAIEAGSVTATNAAETRAIISQADEEFRQQAMVRLQAHHQAVAQAEDIKNLQETQSKAGSLQEQLDADISMGAWNAGLKAEMDSLRQHLDAGIIPAQVYSEQLARIQTAYSTATSVLGTLNKVQRTKAEQDLLARNIIKSYSQQLKDLQKDYLSGVLNTSQYKFAIQNLTQAMRDSTQAAKEEEAAEKAAAAAKRRKIAAAQRGAAGRGRGGGARGGGGGGAKGPLGPAHPMDTLLSQLSMAQGRMQLLDPAGLKFSRNVAAFRKRRASFGQAQLDVAQIQRAIANLRMQTMAGPMMAMQMGRGGVGRLGGDPGMVTQEGNITIELPNVTRVNNEDIASLADRLEDEQKRRGRQVV